ncbi:SpoIIE family protein phosphatase [Streptomyces sp. M19]
MNVLCPTGAFTTASRNVVAAGHLVGGDVHAVRRTRYGIRLLIGDVRGKGPCAAVGAAALLAAFETAAELSPRFRNSSPRWRTPCCGTRVAGRRRAGALRDRRRRPDQPGRPHAAPAEPGPSRAAAAAPDGLLPWSRAVAISRSACASCWAPPRRRGRHGGLPRGATLLMFTDGVTEARDARGTLYEPAARLAPHTAATPADLLDLLHRDVRRHSGATPPTTWRCWPSAGRLARAAPPSARTAYDGPGGRSARPSLGPVALGRGWVAPGHGPAVRAARVRPERRTGTPETPRRSRSGTLDACRTAPRFPGTRLLAGTDPPRRASTWSGRTPRRCRHGEGDSGTGPSLGGRVARTQRPTANAGHGNSPTYADMGMTDPWNTAEEHDAAAPGGNEGRLPCGTPMTSRSSRRFCAV